ncbi:MAG: glycosyltransferase [Bryobacteraceae bacterium]
MNKIWRLLKALPLILISPLLILGPLAALLLADLLRFRRKPRLAADSRPGVQSASVVIPNWNGRDLLKAYLPSVVQAMSGHPDNEVIVVDNGSEDGSADFLREAFPSVRVVALETNLGFGGGSNAGFAAAKNDVVVLLNSDMRVDEGFLQPLLAGFADETVFAVSCQIFFSDPKKPRQETGLTQAWWGNGALRVRHRLDDRVTDLFPCFYGGGGSCAFDRRKFAELGGFDEVLAPFYLEDTDLGYMAWKRGWKVLYQPKSIVFHEHRGTIGKKFTDAQIQAVLKKNFLLFAWKNIHEWRRLCGHFAHAWAAAVVSALVGDSPERASVAGLWRACKQLPGAIRSRRRAQALAAVDDREAFQRPLGGYFRDRFAAMPERVERPGVLFVSPYPICPPVHGGGVFMYQTTTRLAALADLHLVVLLDKESERNAHDELVRQCRSAEFFVRLEGKTKVFGSMEPHAAREFRNGDLEWMIHRILYTQRIDVLQLEYTVMGQYAGGFRRIPSILFEHDVYFQSIASGLPYQRGLLTRLNWMWEYLRAIRYELRLLPKMDRIQVCSRDNREYLESFRPQLRGRIDENLRAGIDTAKYEYREDGRTPYTMLFLGSFRHLPNEEALRWFVKHVLPKIRAREPRARLVIIGSDPPPRHSLPDGGKDADAIELVGFVDDVRTPLAEYSVFLCPILSGSGVRVKLLEAFAAGIPVVSTRKGAEGLADQDGEICALSDDADGFAERVLDLLEDREKAIRLARAARAFVVEERDMQKMTERLVESYRDCTAVMRSRSVTVRSSSSSN